ncbi:hypothetical protein CERSUDRAFT_94965 [Gelatoporia subvermispora B]|uniref:NACHT domain-containing protein n=1 Tax=Ceriporiopsis subvermispora (strain B) TaxID=914234 RepID=M2RCZ9_CERS8|nr:hypothetical protein CERSUDRAFT_94965 [Gelatoporia subvermispora B]
MAINCTSGIPIVSQVLPPLQALVKKIASARANTREKRKVLTEIEDLAKSIQSIGNDLRSCADALRETTHTSGSDPLSSEMSEVVALEYSLLTGSVDDQDTLEKLSPVNASYTSYLTEAKSHLQPGTRSQILHDLVEWVRDDEEKKRVYVLHGPAGMGKSSIAHALCQQLAGNTLEASFFFIRGSITDPYSLFRTLAYQLADSIPDLFNPIVQSTRAHLRRGQCQMLKHQIADLLENPLHALSPGFTRPTLLVVDGIDECMNNSDDVVQEMLQLLCHLATDIPFLRILIATRPESYVMDALHYSKDSNTIIFRNLRDEPDIDDDIRLLVSEKFEQCKAKGGFSLTLEFPDAVERLVKLSDGLFIFAATVVRFLAQNKRRSGVLFNQLLKSQRSNALRRLHAPLDTLYTDILSIAFDKYTSDDIHLGHINEVLGWLVLGYDHEDMEAFCTEDLVHVGISTNVTNDVIDRLRSVLIIHNDVTLTTPLRAYHASFPQFLSDPARCTDPAFLVDPPSGHALIATSLLDLLARDDVDTLRDAIWNLPQMWNYAIGHWDVHLLQARYTPELGRALRGFVETHLEHWLRKRGAWSNSYRTKMTPVNDCVRVRSWCEENEPDDGLVAALDDIID